MDGKRVSLLRKTLTRFAVCMALLLLLATPLFYWLTKNFYAEDMIDIVEAVKSGRPMPALDLEEDIMQGVMLQFGLISAILGIAVVLTVRLISRNVWRPFNTTLKSMDDFRIDKGGDSALPDSDVKEFAKLNAALNSLMTNSRKSFQAQKEFTENASHELQTPLAVLRSRLDLLLQQPGITPNQADMIQDIYQTVNRMTRLCRNLLLLAKMENGQFATTETVDAVAVIRCLSPYIENMLGTIRLELKFDVTALNVKANRPLMESMINNLVVNAIRHNRPDGRIIIRVTSTGLSVTNTSDGGELDKNRIFDRFYRQTNNGKGNGLGLAIVKAVCDCHGWTIKYGFHDGWHEFNIVFS